MNKLVFTLLYVGAMPLTYLLPYLGSNSLLVAAGTHGVTLFATALHLICFAVMLYAATKRGASIGKASLWAFPLIALLFDFLPVLSLVPMVPTVMHVVVLALGLTGEDKA